MPTRRASSEADVELSDINRSSTARPGSMGPDEGSPRARPREEDQDMTDDTASDVSDAPDTSLLQRDDAQKFLAEQAEHGQHFTIRGVIVGLGIGALIAMSNMWFGLQTGWVSGMGMASGLVGFIALSKAPCTDLPFTPVENVLITSVAQAVGTMPLGVGMVGIIPALNYLLTPEENGPLVLSTWKLTVFSVGICFFGVAFGWLLRREVIIREKLKFPSGTATALLIGVLHGEQNEDGKKKPDHGLEIFRQRSQDVRRSSSMDRITAASGGGSSGEEDHRDDWKGLIRTLIYAFITSAVYVKILILPTSSSMLTLLDPHVILHSLLTRSSSLWPHSREQVVMDTKSIPCLHWPRNHHGACDNPTHVSRIHSRLGYPIPTCKEQSMGARTCRRLGYWKQRMDCLGFVVYHVG